MSDKKYHSHAEQQAIVLTARRELFLARLATLPVTEQSVALRVAVDVVERLLMGLKQYGPLDVHDGRRWDLEQYAEELDSDVYKACEQERVETGGVVEEESFRDKEIRRWLQVRGQR